MVKGVFPGTIDCQDWSLFKVNSPYWIPELLVQVADSLVVLKTLFEALRRYLSMQQSVLFPVITQRQKCSMAFFNVLIFYISIDFL